MSNIFHMYFCTFWRQLTTLIDEQPLKAVHVPFTLVFRTNLRADNMKKQTSAAVWKVIVELDAHLSKSICDCKTADERGLIFTNVQIVGN